jgi:DNA-binding GntR family transcriptional regulator
MGQLTKTLLNDEVVDLLRARIYSGEYPLGTPLRQEQLAEELGISRTPLREAFRTLRREGLLQESSQGVRVMSLELGKVLQAYLLREVLDGLTASLAAGRPTAAFGEELRINLDAQRRAVAANDYPNYTEANVGFHFAIWKAADNEFVLAESHILRMTAQLFVPQAVVPRTLASEAVEAHQQIADAVLGGDEQAAERLARAHIRHTIDALAARVEDAHVKGEGSHGSG